MYFLFLIPVSILIGLGIFVIRFIGFSKACENSLEEVDIVRSNNEAVKLLLLTIVTIIYLVVHFIWISREWGGCFTPPIYVLFIIYAVFFSWQLILLTALLLKTSNISQNIKRIKYENILLVLAFLSTFFIHIIITTADSLLLVIPILISSLLFCIFFITWLNRINLVRIFGFVKWFVAFLFIIVPILIFFGLYTLLKMDIISEAGCNM